MKVVKISIASFISPVDADPVQICAVTSTDTVGQRHALLQRDRFGAHSAFSCADLRDECAANPGRYRVEGLQTPAACARLSHQPEAQSRGGLCKIHNLILSHSHTFDLTYGTTAWSMTPQGCRDNP